MFIEFILLFLKGDLLGLTTRRNNFSRVTHYIAKVIYLKRILKSVIIQIWEQLR